MIIKDNTWLKKYQAYEAAMDSANEMSDVFLAWLIDADFKAAAQALRDLAILYKEAYNAGAPNYGKLGFEKKVQQIIHIAQGERVGLLVKERLNLELRGRSGRSIIIFPT